MAKHEEFKKELNVQVTTMIMEKHIKHKLMGLDWKSLQENDPIIQHILKWTVQQQQEFQEGQECQPAHSGGILTDGSQLI